MDNPHSEKSWIERLADALLREPQDRDQLLDLLRDASERKLLDEEALSMIEGVLSVSEMEVREIMIPRSHMVIIDREFTAEQALPIIIESAHSRFPVMNDERTEVSGILLAKDLLPYALKGSDDTTNMKDLARPAVFIPESKRLDVLLKEFRQNRNHMAMVVDEYGNIAGLVTIEDVLEEIVGDISDEYDAESHDSWVEEKANHQYSVNAAMPIDEFNSYFNVGFDEEDFNTIGGLVAQRFGYVPKLGEHIVIDGINFAVSQAGKRRLQRLLVTHENKQ